MLFSVIVVSFNAGEKLTRTLQSIAAQTCQDLEVVIKDAGSREESLAALQRVTALIPADRLVMEVSPDRGIYDGMNRAVELSSGEFLYFLNCGDLLAGEDVLARVRERICRDREDAALSADTPAVYYGDVTEQTTGELAAAKPVMDDFALFRNIPSHQAVFYDRRLFTPPTGRGYDIRYAVRADYEHFLWCHYRAGARMTHLGFAIASYEGGGFSETAENRAVSAKEHKEITAEYMPFHKRALYRLYLILTLQPVRERISRSPLTAGIYQKIRARVYKR